MSRFIDPTAVERLPLPTCECPGSPHDADWVELRTELSGLEWFLVSTGGHVGRTLATIVVAWNFVDAEGEPVPLDVEHLTNLDYATFRAIDDWIESHIATPTLPNASAAPSPSSSRGSGSRTRKVATANSSTTRSSPREVPTGTYVAPVPSS